MYETFYTNLMVTTKQKSRAETQDIKEEKTEKKKKKKKKIIKPKQQMETQVGACLGKPTNNGDTEKPENKR